jgi:hypothetical protein
MSSYYRTRRPRRSRWTVFSPDGARTVFLAHSRETVEQGCVKKGIEFTKVVEGDFGRVISTAQATAQEKGFVASTRTLIIGDSRTTFFRLNSKEVMTSIQELGLKAQVQIRFNARHGSTQGNYRLRPDGKGGHYHNIMLKGYLTAAQASHTLHHELRHAWQAEQQGNAASWYKYAINQRNYAYGHRPIEVDANKWADAHSLQYLTHLI